jgi:hypothetical protein
MSNKKPVKPAKKAPTKTKARKPIPSPATAPKAKFPRHPLSKALRIPQTLFDQNAGKGCTRQEAARFFGLSSPIGPFSVEISSGLKFGLLEQPQPGFIQPSALAKQILRPQSPSDTLDGYRQAILNAPDISEVYQHYRGENLPDDQFLRNTVVETYKVPADTFPEFKQIFIDSLETAELLTRAWRQNTHYRCSGKRSLCASAIRAAEEARKVRQYWSSRHVLRNATVRSTTRRVLRQDSQARHREGWPTSS